MSIASSSINSKQLIKDSQQRLDDEAITTLNFKTIKGNTGGLLTTVNEMRGTFYEANDEFYNIISQFIFLDLNVVYSAITQEARVLDKNEIFESYINDYYNERFMTCLNNYYKNSPAFFKTLFPNQLQNVNNRNVHQSFQKYYYLLCIIQFVNDNYTDERMTGLPINFYNNIVNWCKTRNDPNILYQLNGPNKNQVVTFDFAKHYHSLISVQDTTQDINDYNKLVRLQNIDDGLMSLFNFLKNMPNVYNKNADNARQYILNIDTGTLKDKYVDADGKLVFDLANMDFGDTTNDTTRAHIDEIDKLQTKDITLSKLNIKKLEKIFNMYSRLKVESLIVDKRTYVNNLTKYPVVYLVFEGIQCSDRTVGNNKYVANGDLAIPGKFTLDSNDNYVFQPFSEYTTYRPDRTRVQKCHIYLTYDRNKIITPYEISLDISRNDIYNIPLQIIDYNPHDYDFDRLNSNGQFSDILHNNTDVFNVKKFDDITANQYEQYMSDKQITKTYNGCYLIPTYDFTNDVITLTNTGYLYDADTNLINHIQINDLNEDILNNFFMHEQKMSNKAYVFNVEENEFQQIESLESLQKYIRENTGIASRELENYINIYNPLIVYRRYYAYRNHEIKYQLVKRINIFTNLLITSLYGENFDIILTIDDPIGVSPIYEIQMPLIPDKYIIYSDGSTNIEEDTKIEYTIISTTGKYFDIYSVVIGDKTYNGTMPFNIEINTDNIDYFNAFVFKKYTTLKFSFMLYKDSSQGIHYLTSVVDFNTTLSINILSLVNFVNKTDIITTIVDTTKLPIINLTSNDELKINGETIYIPKAQFDKSTNKFYKDFYITDNCLYNPLSCYDFTNKLFTETIFDNNISMITYDDADMLIKNVSTFIPQSTTSENTTININNCYISTSLTDDKTYLKDGQIVFNVSDKNIHVGDISNDKLYVWKPSTTNTIYIENNIYKFDVNSNGDIIDNNTYNNLYILLEDTTLYDPNQLLIDYARRPTNQLIDDYINDVKSIISNYIINMNKSIDYGLDLTNTTNSTIYFDLPKKINDTHNIKNKNFTFIVNIKTEMQQITAVVYMVVLQPIELTSFKNYTVHLNFPYIKSIVMFSNNKFNIVHYFEAYDCVVSEVFTNKYSNFLTTRMKISLEQEFLSFGDGIELYIPYFIQIIEIPTCHKLVTKQNGLLYKLNETLVETVIPDNYYSNIDYSNNNILNINLDFGYKDYYKRFIYLYKHINMLYKNPLIYTNKSLSNYDNITINDKSSYLTRYSKNSYAVFNENDIKQMNITIKLNKSDTYLTLSWS